MMDVSRELIDKAAEGDMASFEAIFRAYSGYVLNVSLRVLNNKEDAQEVVQEVFLMLHGKLKGFRHDASLKTWIYRITVNMAINHYRKRRRERERAVVYDEAVHAGSSGEGEAAVEKEYKESVIQKSLDRLSEEQRVCIILRSFEGLSYEQIASSLKIDINAVRSRLKRAREKLMGIREEVMANGL